MRTARLRWSYLLQQPSDVRRMRGPEVNKCEQVSSDSHQMSLAGGEGPGQGQGVPEVPCLGKVGAGTGEGSFHNFVGGR